MRDTGDDRTFDFKTAVRREFHHVGKFETDTCPIIFCHTLWCDKCISNFYTGTVPQVLVWKKMEVGSNLNLPELYFRPPTVSIYCRNKISHFLLLHYTVVVSW